MRSPVTFLVLGIVGALLFALVTVPTVAADYPLGEDTRIIRMSLWSARWNIVATYPYTSENRDTSTGTHLSVIQTTVQISKDYADTAEEAITNTRIFVTITAPNSSIVLNNSLLDEIIWYPNDILENRWELAYCKEFPIHVIMEGTYTFEVDYEIFDGDSWISAGSQTYHLTSELPPEPSIDRRIVRTTLWRDKWDIICTYPHTASERSCTTGYYLSVIQTTIQVGKDYADTAENAIAYTRVYATITAPNLVVVYDDNLTEVSWYPNDVLVDRWELAYCKQFSPHYLIAGTYTIAVTYEVWDGDNWEATEARIYTLLCGAPPDIPGEPDLPDVDISTGVSGLVTLFLPFTGDDATAAGYLVGIFFFMAPLTIIGLAVVAASKAREYGGLVIMGFFLLGMFICVLTGLFPWWFLVAIIAIVSLVFARGWFGKE